MKVKFPAIAATATATSDTAPDRPGVVPLHPDRSAAARPGTVAKTRLLCMVDELDLGGTEQQILELVKTIDRSRFEPMVCCFRYGRKAAEIAELGVPVFQVAKNHKLDAGILLRLVELLRRERIDILQTYLWTANTWGRVAGRLAGVPIVVASERNIDIWEQNYKRIIGRYLAGSTDRIIANSEAVRRYLLERGGLDPAKVTTIYNGVNFDRFATATDPMQRRHELGIPDDALLAGVVARVEPAKDHDTLLHALALVRDRTPNLHLAVVGDGTQKERLTRLAHELGIGERIHFTGFRTDAAEWIASFDFTVLSSVKEGLSNTVIESMAAGKPVIATAVGGNPEVIVEDETGYLLPARDPARFGEAVARLVAEKHRIPELGAASKKRVESLFSVDKMVENTTRLYLELLARRQKRAA
jgi:glycosyltransferase involved in cell wall biosynthesis